MPPRAKIPTWAVKRPVLLVRLVRVARPRTHSVHFQTMPSDSQRLLKNRHQLFQLLGSQASGSPRLSGQRQGLLRHLHLVNQVKPMPRPSPALRNRRLGSAHSVVPIIHSVTPGPVPLVQVPQVHSLVPILGHPMRLVKAVLEATIRVPRHQQQLRRRT